LTFQTFSACHFKVSYLLCACKHNCTAAGADYDGAREIRYSFAHQVGIMCGLSLGHHHQCSFWSDEKKCVIITRSLSILLYIARAIFVQYVEPLFFCIFSYVVNYISLFILRSLTSSRCDNIGP